VRVAWRGGKEAKSIYSGRAEWMTQKFAAPTPTTPTRSIPVRLLGQPVAGKQKEREEQRRRLELAGPKGERNWRRAVALGAPLLRPPTYGADASKDCPY